MPLINCEINVILTWSENVPVVTLSTEDDKIFLEQLKSEFITTIKWKRYRSEMTNRTKTNTLNYSIDATFNKASRLLVLSFQKEHLFQSIIHQKLK